jgi:hypothetical protein
MAFTRLSSRPKREAFLTPEAISQITDEQFTDQVRYWQRVRKIGGETQVVLATTMLQEVMETVDVVRAALSLPEQERRELPGNIEPLAKSALAGLSLAVLLRRAYPMLPELGYNIADHEPRELNIDARLGGLGIAMVHDPLDSIEGVLPFDRSKKVSWYEDELLIVSAATPAFATADFESGFPQMYGRDFVAEDYVTLQPRLKATFVTPA